MITRRDNDYTQRQGLQVETMITRRDKDYKQRQ